MKNYKTPNTNLPTNSRRDFLNKAAAVSAVMASGSLITSACGNAEETSKQDKGTSVDMSQTYEWSLSTSWPPNFPVFGEGLSMFAKLIEEMSAGRMKIKVFGAGEKVPQPELFDAVSNGVIEMGHGASYYWAGKSKALQLFASVPFGLNAQQITSWVNNGGGYELWKEIYGKFNIVPFIGGNTGVQMGGWFNKEINSVEDLKGLKMRIPGLGGAVLAKAGGTAVSVAGGEIYTNLERGVIDATEWIGPYHDYKLGLYKIAKYYYSPGWHEPGTILDFIVNKQKYEALPTDLQAIIRAATAQTSTWIFSEFEVKNNQFLEKIKAESKAELRQFPDEVLADLRTKTQEVLQEQAQNDPDFQKVYESFLAFQKDASAWAELTEKRFYNQLQS